MTQVLGWTLLLASLICIFCPFVTLVKLRKLRKLIASENLAFESEMPSTYPFGSYRKSLKWVKENRNMLPKKLNTIANNAIFLDRAAIGSLGFIILVAIISSLLSHEIIAF